MQHGESRTNKPPYQAIKTNYKLLRSKMRWISNSSTWNDPIDVTQSSIIGSMVIMVCTSIIKR